MMVNRQDVAKSNITKCHAELQCDIIIEWRLKTLAQQSLLLLLIGLISASISTDSLALFSCKQQQRRLFRSRFSFSWCFFARLVIITVDDDDEMEVAGFDCNDSLVPGCSWSELGRATLIPRDKRVAGSILSNSRES